MSDSVAQAIMTEKTSGVLTVIFHECEEGGVTAECIELPNCFSEGETQEEAEQNIRDAMDACLSVIFEECLDRLRASVDFGRVHMSRVSKQETFNVQIPRLQVPEYA